MNGIGSTRFRKMISSADVGTVRSRDPVISRFEYISSTVHTNFFKQDWITTIRKILFTYESRSTK